MVNKKFIKQVGLRLKRRRKELDYTQAYLVELINKNCVNMDDDLISEKQISRFESGHNMTRLDKFLKWSLALGKTPDYFLLGIENGDETDVGKIEQICNYLKLCKPEDIDNVFLFVKALYNKNNQ